VRIGDEVVDGNVDCLSENPLVPDIVRVAPYWGRSVKFQTTGASERKEPRGCRPTPMLRIHGGRN